MRVSRKRTIKQYKEDKKNAVEKMKSFHMKPSAELFKQIYDLLSSTHIDSMRWWAAACCKKYNYDRPADSGEYNKIAAASSDEEIIEIIMREIGEKDRDMSCAKAAEVLCQIYSANGDKIYLVQCIKLLAEISDKKIAEAVENMIGDLGKISTKAAEVVRNKDSIIADFYKNDIDKKNAELLESFDQLFPIYETSAELPQCDLFTFAESL